MHLKDYREREGGGQHGEIESAKLLEREILPSAE